MEKQHRAKEMPQPFIPVPIPILVPITPGEFKEIVKRVWPA